MFATWLTVIDTIKRRRSDSLITRFGNTSIASTLFVQARRENLEDLISTRYPSDHSLSTKYSKSNVKRRIRSVIRSTFD